MKHVILALLLTACGSDGADSLPETFEMPAISAEEPEVEPELPACERVGNKIVVRYDPNEGVTCRIVND